MHAFLQRPPASERATAVKSGWPGHRTGERLDAKTQSWAQRAFRFDFSQVRIHHDAEATSSRGAAAFALGSDIYLGAEARDVASPSGRRLLAHELAHVVQQAERTADPGRVEAPDSPAEREAHDVADRVAGGQHAPQLRQVPAGLPRAALVSDGGEFVVSGYNTVDSDPGNDTAKTCGVDISIAFTPATKLRSEQISFVQIMRMLLGGTPVLLENEKARATTAWHGHAGWAVDRLAGNKYADYQIGNDDKEVPTWGQLGYRKSDADARDATLNDKIRMPRAAGQKAKVEARSFTLDKTNGKYLGGVSWGVEVDAKGVVAKTAESIASKNSPRGIQKVALKRWNEQAKNPDAAKRNDPDQVPITVP